MRKRSLVLYCVTAALVLTAVSSASARNRRTKSVQAYVERQSRRAQLAWARHVVFPLTSGALAREVRNRPPDAIERVLIERNLTAVRTCMQPLAKIVVPEPLRWKEARRGRSLLGAARSMVTHKVKRDIAATRRQGWRLHRQSLQQERDYTTNLLQTRGAAQLRKELAQGADLPWGARQTKRIGLFVLGQHVFAVNTLRRLDALPR